ncbi:MAG: hypothetical protein GY943_24610, partial [Chloroflexi bacterium]|nr:hypothetical protein [Chloroflexota bacterium]
ESATIHSNIYTMGVMLYTLLAGHAPHYSAAEWDIFDQQNSRQMVPLSDVRPDVKSDTLQIVRHCMWGQAWRRYDNTTELIAAIDAALAATKAAPLIESEEKRSVLATVLDNRVVLYAGIAIVLLIMALMIGFIFRDSGETAVSTTQSNLTAVPNSAIAAEATETAVLTNTPASANAPIQISMIRPEPEEMYA